jgi:heme-degrading monooxygenase HmoA
MPFISVTRLRVKSIFFLLPFIRANEASVKEIKKSKGFLKGKELIDKKLTFWTITIWENEESMKEFRSSTSHRIAMQHLPKWCDEASYHHWVQEETEFPTWDNISEKLFSEGRLSKVRNPSKAQVENQFPPIKWTKTERRLK